jgi:membrane-bound lytic murein transglycosylase B
MRVVAAAQAAAVADPASEKPYSARYRAELVRVRARIAAACVATALAPAMAIAHADARPVPPAPPAPPSTLAALAQAPPLPGVATPPTVEPWAATARASAATCPGLPSQVLVAIADVETGFGRAVAPSPAGAEGPMQFLPATWAAYGEDGNGDGVADVMNPVDAMYGAARLLCANGGGEPNRLGSALWNYNHSDAYVARVLALAGLPARTTG